MRSKSFAEFMDGLTYMVLLCFFFAFSIILGSHLASYLSDVFDLTRKQESGILIASIVVGISIFVGFGNWQEFTKQMQKNE